MTDEQIISVEQEQAEQTIEVESVQSESSIAVRSETIDVTVNLDYEPLANKPSINGIELEGDKTSAELGIDIPTNVSELNNDAGYLTEHQSLSSYYTKTETDTLLADKADTEDIPTVPSNVSAFTNDAGYLTEHQDLSAYAKSADLATVATSGSYNDLTDTPTIPTVPTNLSSFTDDLGSSPAHTHSQYLTSHQSLSAYAKTADLATVATSGSYDDLSDTPTIPTVPTTLSSFTDDLGSSPTHTHSQYLTSHQDLSAYALSADIPTALSELTDDLGTNPVHSHMMDSLNPITSKTFSNVLATSTNVNTLFPFMRVIPTEWDDVVRVDYRIKAYVSGRESTFMQNSECYFTFFHNTTPAYCTRNFVGSTSYRPLYYHSLMSCVESYKSIGHLVGINFYNAGNSYSRSCTTSGYGRTFEIEIIHTENCTIEWLDTCATVSSSTVSGYVADTTHSAIANYNGTTQGETHSGDANSNTIPTGYCTTGAKTAAKSASCNYGYRDDPNYFPCLFRYANTASNATLAISSYATTALPIYVNGARTTSSNTFGAGVILFLYYNNAYWCYNDGRFPIVVNGSVTSIQDALGNYTTESDVNTLIATALSAYENGNTSTY